MEIDDCSRKLPHVGLAVLHGVFELCIDDCVSTRSYSLVLSLGHDQLNLHRLVKVGDLIGESLTIHPHRWGGSSLAPEDSDVAGHGESNELDLVDGTDEVKFDNVKFDDHFVNVTGRTRNEIMKLKAVLPVFFEQVLNPVLTISHFFRD